MYHLHFLFYHLPRERNREHAKRSRVRKKFLLESLQQSVSLLKEENQKLRTAIRQNVPADDRGARLVGGDETRETFDHRDFSQLVVAARGNQERQQNREGKRDRTTGALKRREHVITLGPDVRDRNLEQETRPPCLSLRRAVRLFGA